MHEDAFINTGYTVLQEVIPPAMFDKLKMLGDYYIDRALKRQNHSGNVCFKLFRTDNIINDFLMPELINLQPVYDILKNVLGPGFILKEILVYFSEPGNEIQELHRDSNQLFTAEATITPAYQAIVQYPLIHFNAASGGTRMIDGTQYTHDEPTRLENEDLSLLDTITPEVPQRGCMIRDSRTWHGSGANRSDQVRSMFTLAFARRWYGSPGTVSKELYFGLDKEKRHLVTS